jgi:hypothetical protein
VFSIYLFIYLFKIPEDGGSPETQYNYPKNSVLQDRLQGEMIKEEGITEIAYLY